ncbi:MAG TPA: glycosyltransferase [Candidatus Acidoferrales bacterium]|nr:glycosyltransferase [Candidatus Acidoferrales bacterium]
MPQLRNLRIIIPACDEERRIGPTVEDYCSTFRETGIVQVVANGCTDATCDVIRNLQRRHLNLSLVEVPGRIGKGGAVRVGFCGGTEDYVGFVDADGSTPAAEFLRLFQRLRQSGTDAVIGSRWIPGATVDPPQPVSRRVASRAFNAIVRGLFGISFADTQCGAKIFTRRAISEIFRSLEIANFAFDIEILWRLQRAGFSILEEPTKWSDRSGTKIKLLRSSWAMFTSLLRMRMRETAWWFVPFIDRLGGAGAIPVIERHRLLLLERSAGSREHVGRVAELLALLRASGFEIMNCEDEIEAPWLKRLCARRGIAGSLALLYWYVGISHRHYDGIIEIATGKTSWISSFSTKPSFVVVATHSSALSNALAMSSKVTLLDLDDITPDQAARTVSTVQSLASPYARAFISTDDVSSESGVEGIEAWRLTELQR